MSSRVVCKTYGRVSEEQQKAMSGLEFVQGLVDGSLPLQHDGSDPGVRHH